MDCFQNSVSGIDDVLSYNAFGGTVDRKFGEIWMDIEHDTDLRGGRRYMHIESRVADCGSGSRRHEAIGGWRERGDVMEGTRGCDGGNGGM